MCKSIRKLLDKFAELDSDFVRIKHEYHHAGRRNELGASGVQHLRHDKVFCYRRNQTTFQCPMCITNSVTISSLMTHLRKHHKVAIPDGFVCLYCNKPFRIVSQLAPHLWAHHRSKKITENFHCSGCGETFNDKFQTIDHIPKCLSYCAGVNFVLRMQHKNEAKVQEQFNNFNTTNIDDQDEEI
jgi:transcription elongation factor Elf1